MKSLEIYIITEKDLENHSANTLSPNDAIRKILHTQQIHSADYIAIERNGRIDVVKDRKFVILEKINEVVNIVRNNRK